MVSSSQSNPPVQFTYCFGRDSKTNFRPCVSSRYGCLRPWRSELLVIHERYSHNSKNLKDSFIHLTDIDTKKINTISSYDLDSINGERHMLDEP